MLDILDVSEVECSIFIWTLRKNRNFAIIVKVCPYSVMDNTQDSGS